MVNVAELVVLAVSPPQLSKSLHRNWKPLYPMRRLEMDIVDAPVPENIVPVPSFPSPKFVHAEPVQYCQLY